MNKNELSLKEVASFLTSEGSLELSKINDTSYNIIEVEYNEKEAYIGIFTRRPNIRPKYVFMLTPTFNYFKNKDTLYVECEGSLGYTIRRK